MTTCPEKCRNSRPGKGRTLLDTTNTAASFWQSFSEHCLMWELNCSLRPMGPLNHGYLQNASGTEELPDLELGVTWSREKEEDRRQSGGLKWYRCRSYVEGSRHYFLIVLRKTLGELCGRLWSARPEGGQWVEKRFLVRNDLDTWIWIGGNGIFWLSRG